MTDRQPSILSAKGVTYGFPRRPDFLQAIDLRVDRGEFWGIIGPNGAGKSTLLRLLAGLWKPAAGRVHLDDRPLAAVAPLERARRIAFLPQQMPADLAAAVREVVLMGRFPHRRLSLFDNADDRRIADRALVAMQAEQLADRPMTTLSGGEAQRVHIAAVIAQQPTVLLLDEPTASLDLYHQLSIFSLLRNLVQRDRLAVVVVTHDINLAARFCSRILLLHEGRPVASGPPADVIRPEILAPVYGVELAAVASPEPPGTWIVPRCMTGHVCGAGLPTGQPPPWSQGGPA